MEFCSYAYDVATGTIDFTIVTETNGECSTDAIALGLLKLVVIGADADFNGDGVVNAIDLGIVKSRFFDAPGPSYRTLSRREL